MKLAAFAATLVLLLAVAGGARAATGGPDAFGYSWADSDEFNVTAMAPGFAATDLRGLGFVGDESVIRLTLPASLFPTGFPFYGASYTDLWLSSNGWLSFIDPAGDARPLAVDIPAGSTPNAMVAFFWDDWTLDHIAPLATAGPNDANDGYSIAVRLAAPVITTLYAHVTVTLFQDGDIKIVYRREADSMATSRTVIGLESPTGTDGLPFMASGTPLHGAHIGDPSAVQFFRGGELDCSTAVTPVTCPLAPTSFDIDPAPNAASSYNCAVGSFGGSEMLFRFDVTTISNVTVDLTDLGGLSLYAFLLRGSCNEHTGCVVGGATSLSARFLTPGTYYIVVDGLDARDTGTFTLEVGCADAVTSIACGDTRIGEATSGVSTFDAWSCATDMTGPENIYSVTLATAANLRATLTSKSDPALEVLISDAATFDAAAPACLVADPTRAELVGAPPGTYLVSVDGRTGGAGSYDLTVECRRDLACGGPVPSIDPFDSTPIAGDTTGGVNTAEAYSCDRSGFGSAEARLGFDGPEDVYRFTLGSPATVSFLFTPSDPDLRLFLLRECYEGECVMEGACAVDLPAGNYWLVVDGLGGAAGSYVITPTVLPPTPFTSWLDCPECANGCGQPEDAVRRTHWSFDSGNYCGTGCDFSLFVVVDCGSEFHLPLFDVETGHLAVYDVLRERFVELEVENDQPLPTCSFADAGPYVEWEDSGCSAIPCPTADCGGGDDCHGDNATMDVKFTGQPSVCGIYRLDFQNWGGFAWDVYANCTGTQLEQHLIFPDLCSAFANYRPLPEIGIADITIDNTTCGSLIASGTVTLENVGCAPAVDVELIIEQAPPATPSPKTIAVTIPAGGAVTIPWTYDLTTPPAALRFLVDPGAQTSECSDTGGGSGCGVRTVLERIIPMDVCTCIVNTVPPAVGNSLLAVRDGDDVMLWWSALAPGDISVHRLFKDTAPDLPVATRIMLRDVSASVTLFTDVGAVTDPLQPLAHYQVIGVSCFGDLEGP